MTFLNKESLDHYIYFFYSSKYLIVICLFIYSKEDAAFMSFFVFVCLFWSAWAPCHWFLLLGRRGVAFIERRLYFVILFIIFLGFYVTSTQDRSYRDVPALLVEEDLRCPSVHYFRHERVPE
jgi:membrane protease YdiL (CAAX protease family)